MSEYMSIHREGQRAKWHKPNDSLTITKSEDSISSNHIDICAIFLTEGPNLTSRGHVVNEESENTTASSTLRSCQEFCSPS
jgi:hypothetical protein